MKAMIFSAGLGTRFKPWTDKHPKALAKVSGKTLLQHNIEYLQKHGITEVIVNVHHFADQVIEALDKNKGWGSSYQLSDEREELLDTGGGMLKAKSLFNPGERFLTCNVDVLTDLDIGQLTANHASQKPLITFGVSDRKTSRYLLFDDKLRLSGWRNVNSGEEIIVRGADVLIQRAYSCVAVFEYDVFQYITLKGKFSLIDLYLQLAKEHLILVYEHNGDKWVDVGRPESVEVAVRLFGS